MKNNLWTDSAAQVSMEMILVIAAVLAVALIAITSLRDTATSGDKMVDKTAKKVMKELK